MSHQTRFHWFYRPNFGREYWKSRSFYLQNFISLLLLLLLLLLLIVIILSLVRSTILLGRSSKTHSILCDVWKTKLNWRNTQSYTEFLLCQLWGHYGNAMGSYWYLYSLQSPENHVIYNCINSARVIARLLHITSCTFVHMCRVLHYITYEYYRFIARSYDAIKYWKPHQSKAVDSPYVKNVCTQVTCSNYLKTVSVLHKKKLS
jgi:hypothetical protein